MQTRPSASAPCGIAPTAAEYLTDQAVADMLAVTTRTTMRWRQHGGGPSFCRVGERRILYRRADVEAWLAARTFGSRAAEAVHKAA